MAVWSSYLSSYTVLGFVDTCRIGVSIGQWQPQSLYMLNYLSKAPRLDTDVASTLILERDFSTSNAIEAAAQAFPRCRSGGGFMYCRRRYMAISNALSSHAACMGLIIRPSMSYSSLIRHELIHSPRYEVEHLSLIISISCSRFSLLLLLQCCLVLQLVHSQPLASSSELQ